MGLWINSFFGPLTFASKNLLPNALQSLYCYVKAHQNYFVWRY